MMLTLLLIVSTIAQICSAYQNAGAPTAVKCKTIDQDIAFLMRAEKALGCCTSQNCNKVEKEENEHCKTVTQQKLQPCLLNANSTCLAEAIAVLEMSPSSPCRGFNKTCSSLESSRNSLMDLENRECPQIEGRATRNKRVIVCETMCIAACGAMFIPCVWSLFAPLCFGGCATCLAGAVANMFC